MNPLMTLVDVASSILYAEMEGPSTTSSDIANGTREPWRTDSRHSPLSIMRRPFTPPSSTTTTTSTTTMDMVPAVSPTSSVTTTTTFASSPATINPSHTPQGAIPTLPSSSSPSPCGPTDYDKQTFSSQLVALLDDDDFEFLTWMPDGTAFTIVKPKVFTKEYMPKYFNIRNMSSFVRKLTRWGFTRVHEATTMNSDIFKHPHFQRGRHHNNHHNNKAPEEGECPSDDIVLKQQTTTIQGATVVPLSPKAAFRPISGNHSPTSGPLLPSSFPNHGLSSNMMVVPPRTMNLKPIVPQYLPSQTWALRRYYYVEQQQQQSWWKARAYNEAAAAASVALYHRTTREESTTPTN